MGTAKVKSRHGALCGHNAIRKLFLVTPALMAASSWADIDYSSYVQLTANETAMSAWNQGAHWSDGNPPDPAKNYYVPENLQMYLAGSKTSNLGSWNGGELAIAGKLKIYVSHDKAFAPVISGLVLLDNALVDLNFPYSFLLSGSQVTVRSSAANPATMDYSTTYGDTPGGNGYTTDYGLGLYATFLGTPDVGLRMIRSTTVRPELRSWRSHGNSWKNYLGTLTVTGAATEFRMLQGQRLDFAGSLVVEDGAKLNPVYKTPDYTTTAANIANLTLQNGGVLQALTKDGAVYPLYTVTDSFAASGATLDCDLRGGYDALFPGATSLDDSASYGVKLLRLTGDAAANAGADAFAGLALTVTNNLNENVLSAFPELKLLRKAEADGSVGLYLGCDNLIAMRTVNGSPDGYSAFYPTNGNFWSNGVVPSPDSDKTYYIARMLDIKEDPLWMPNATFILGGSAHYWNVSAPEKAILQVKELHFLPGAGLHCWSYLGQRRIEAEKIVFHGAAGKAASMLKANGAKGTGVEITYVWAAPFFGDGDFMLTNRGFAPEVSHSFVGNDNSAYAGRLIIGNTEGNTNDTIVTRLRIGAARELGGAVAADKDSWKAVEIFGYGALEVTNDVTLTAADRAFYFDNRARLVVSNEASLVMGSGLTFNGSVTKLGTGSLVLAGEAPHFVGADGTLAETPLAASNRLTIAEGALKIGAIDVANGLEVAFAAGTRLVLDAAASGELARYGMRNTAWDVPLVLSEGVLPVSIVGVPDGLRTTLGLCTVSAAADAALNLGTTSFDVSVPSGYRLTARTRTVNEDGTVTYAATFARRGLSFSLR
ncbi:MAG: hypothetical protein MJ240_12850 [Kiritimatiellae bacterium]|nr:hypothetical protein [Kiritimatiellia bacterium]